MTGEFARSVLGRVFDAGSNATVRESLGRLVRPEMADEENGVKLLEALSVKPEVPRGVNFSRKLFEG